MHLPYIEAILNAVGIVSILVSKDRSARAAAHQDSPSRSTEGLSGALRNSSILVLCTSNLCHMLVYRGVRETVFQIYLIEYLLTSLSFVGRALVVRSVGSTLATSGSGFFMSRMGIKQMIVSGLITEAVAMTGYTFTNSPEIVLPIALLGGLESGILSVSLTIALSEQAKTSQIGSTIGFYRTFQDVDQIGGPIVMMAILDSSCIRFCFYAGALILIANVTIQSKLLRPQKTDE